MRQTLLERLSHQTLTTTSIQALPTRWVLQGQKTVLIKPLTLPGGCPHLPRSDLFQNKSNVKGSEYHRKTAEQASPSSTAIYNADHSKCYKIHTH